MEDKYESLSLAALRELAKARGIRGVSAVKKSIVIEKLREYDAMTVMPEAEPDPASRERQSRRATLPEKQSQRAPQQESSQEKQSRRVPQQESSQESAQDKHLRRITVQEESQVWEQPGQAQRSDNTRVEDEKRTGSAYENRSREQRSYSRPTEESTEQRGRLRSDRTQTARSSYENRPSRPAAAQESRPLRPAAAQESRPLRPAAVQEGRPRPGTAQEGRFSRSAAQEGRSVRPASPQESRSARPVSSQEGRPVRSASPQESRSAHPVSSQEGGSVRSLSQQEGRPLLNQSVQEGRPMHLQPAQEGRSPRVQSVQEGRSPRIQTTSGNHSTYDSLTQDNRQGRTLPAQENRTAAASSTGLADTDKPPAELAQLDSGQTISGILEVMQDGYGFIRGENYLPGENDVYVSPSQIRRFNMKTGDVICGNTRIKTQQEKFSALLYVKSISGMAPSEAARRCNFEDMTPVFPNKRLRMERGSRAVAMRIVDLFSPIGKGQRGMIVSPPKAGKTTLLKDVARSILQNDPDMQLIILLIDERPEEVTDIREAICGDNVEVIYSTFDELPEHHKRVSEMTIERAKRLVEQKRDVTILLDSITRLARAYNLTVPPSGRTLSGGLDPAALHMPKRFFGAARNMREGGSLTVLATALIDTGSKMDDVVYEEFKGTGNMELVLDRKLSEKRLFPAIDIPKSGTRREDLLLDREELEAVEIMRRALNGMKSDDAVENILNMFVHTRDNRELVQRVRRQKFV